MSLNTLPTGQVSILGHMPNVEIVSLSVNSINSLREFGNCKKLKELYLRKNNVTDLTEGLTQHGSAAPMWMLFFS